MDDHADLQQRMARLIDQRLCRTYQEFKADHDKMLSDLTLSAQGSVVYKDRAGVVSSVDELTEIPLTSYYLIDDCTKRHGIDRVLLTKPVKFWQISGSTGDPKRFCYGERDVEEISVSYVLYRYIAGIRPWRSLWDFGRRDPLLSSSLVTMAYA